MYFSFRALKFHTSDFLTILISDCFHSSRLINHFK